MHNSCYVWEEAAAAQALSQQPSAAKLILCIATKLGLCCLTLHYTAVANVGVNRVAKSTAKIAAERSGGS